MNKDSKRMLIMIGAVALIVIVIIAGVKAYSGMSRPLTVVESDSMQHSLDTSYLGIIDTGDMVVMVSPSKASITTYVEGRMSDYSKFGSYGDVIIYYREGKNPVIHRAIIWLDYKDDKWSAPALEHYDRNLWSIQEGDWNDLKGILTLKDLPSVNGTKEDISIDLNVIETPGSGYLTKGDNNRSFDQPSIHKDTVKPEELKAVAGKEIPWLGCIKLLVNHKNVSLIPNNSVPCLGALFLDIITFIFLISMISEYISFVRKNKEKE